MIVSAVAARYADAFADIVTEPGSGLRPEDALRELREFQSLLASAADFQNVLISPAVPGSRKKAVVARIGKLAGLSRITLNFLFVLIDRRRLAGLPEILHVIEQKLDERLGFAGAEVVSARELTEAQRAALSAELERRAGKRIRLRVSVDEALIGGVVARIGSTVYDGSVRGRLKSLERRLSAERYS